MEVTCVISVVFETFVTVIYWLQRGTLVRADLSRTYQSVNKLLLEESDSSIFVFIFNCIINNLKGGGGTAPQQKPI
jgi:hypothetical protein